MKSLKLLLPIFIFFLLAIGALFCLPAMPIAHAQEPGCSEEPTEAGHFDPESDPKLDIFLPEGDESCFRTDYNVVNVVAGYDHGVACRRDVATYSLRIYASDIVSHAINKIHLQSLQYRNNVGTRIYQKIVYIDESEDFWDTDSPSYNFDTWSSTENISKSVDYFEFGATNFYPNGENGWELDDVYIYYYCIPGDEPEESSCSTVNDWHFTGEITDAWTIVTPATITNSIAYLPNSAAGGKVYQRYFTPTMGLSYNAVISVSEVDGSDTELKVFLGDIEISTTLAISQPGLYTATFEYPDAVSDNIYELKNYDTGANLSIDWTCIYTGAVITSTEACIAPLNGVFTNTDHWDWYRGAAYNAPSQNALLPFNEGGDDARSLIMTTDIYSLPTLAAGQYLILKFSGASQGGQDAMVASRVLSSWQEFQLVSTTPVTLYADISAQAGLSATIAFANAGSAGGAGAEQCQYAAQDGALVDNVCIFVSSAPAQESLVITNTFCPVDLGFDFGCNDVDWLLAGYGINVYAVEPIYTAGPTWADPSGYIPWLAAALWLHVGKPICCFIVEFMRLVVDLAEYEVNVFANYTGWSYETVSYFAPWLQTGLGTVTVDAGRWSYWNSKSAKNVLQNGGVNWTSQTNWSQYLSSTDLSGATCTRYTVASGFNGLGSGWGEVISQLAADVATAWNESIIVYFYLSTDLLGQYHGEAVTPPADPDNPADPWAKVLDLFLWLIQFVGQIVSLVWELLRWLINFLTTGASAPIDAYHSFAAGVSSEAYEVDVVCEDANWWCVFWAGVALVNQTTAQSILYPITITGIICLTLVIVFRNLYDMFHINIS